MRILSLLAASTALTLAAQAGEAVTYEVHDAAYEGYLAEATHP